MLELVSSPILCQFEWLGCVFRYHLNDTVLCRCPSQIQLPVGVSKLSKSSCSLPATSAPNSHRYGIC
jgi:hypothetical protein